MIGSFVAVFGKEGVESAACSGDDLFGPRGIALLEEGRRIGGV
jgi:hypothetical protein